MTSTRSDALESAASHAAETPPAGHAPTADSRASGREGLAPPRSVGGEGSVGGVGGEPQARGRSPMRGGSGAEPPIGASEAAPSSLDTEDITRPERHECALQEAWLHRVGELTADFRNEKAEAYRARGRSKVLAASAAGESEFVAWEQGAWDRSRALGQKERIERVLQCGAKEIVVTCGGCGKQHEVSVGCRIGILCIRCRGRNANKKRLQVLANRNVLLRNASERGLLNPNRRGGRWSEKFVTLTVPHLTRDTVASRTKRLRDAIPKFLKSLNRFLEECGANKTSQFVRVLEWTSGTDVELDPAGNPHAHMWIFSPFLDQQLATVWWHNALYSTGVDQAVSLIVVHLREVTGTRGAMDELVKYLFKDIDSKGRKVSPEVYAEVYKAFDGARSIQSSSGFMKLAPNRAMCECGTDLPNRTRMRREYKDELAAEVEGILDGELIFDGD